MKSDWVPTKEMADELGINRVTLQRLRRDGFLKEKQHWVKVNPLAPRSNHLWHRTRTMMKMGRI